MTTSRKHPIDLSSPSDVLGHVITGLEPVAAALRHMDRNKLAVLVEEITGNLDMHREQLLDERGALDTAATNALELMDGMRGLWEAAESAEHRLALSAEDGDLDTNGREVLERLRAALTSTPKLPPPVNTRILAACKAALLWQGGGWSEEDLAEWVRLTGSEAATSPVLRAFLRAAIDAGEQQQVQDRVVARASVNEKPQTDEAAALHGVLDDLGVPPGTLVDRVQLLRDHDLLHQAQEIRRAEGLRGSIG